jgi:YVTN family beta-propeller protein
MCAALAALLLCVATPVLHAEALTPRALLGTGDLVPGFGRIGVGGFSLLGIADDGRLLVAGSLADGRQGLFWANDHRLAPLWISGDTPGVTLDVQHAHASGNGNVVAFAYAGTQWNAGFYYVFSPGAVPRIVVPSRTDQTGNTLCRVDAALINDAGTIAFHANIAPPGSDCTAFSDLPPNGIYAASAAGMREVIGSTNPTATAEGVPLYTSLGVIALTRDGTVITSSYAVGGSLSIMAVRDGVVSTLVSSGTLGPDGVPLTPSSVTAANDLGDVLFVASAGPQVGLYRTDHGRIISIGHGGAAEALSDGGDVAMLTTQGPTSGGISVIGSAGGASQIFPLNPGTAFGRYVTSDGPLFFNAAGSLAFTVNAYGGSASLVALRWTAGQIDEVLASGDLASDGTALAAGGIQKPMCLAPDGRVVVGARATTGNDALLCLDAAGPHVIAQDGDPVPEGFAFAGFETPCTFTSDGGIIFSGDRAVPYGNRQLYVEASVYRASGQGIERLFGDGDPVSNGTFIADSGSSVNFVPNRRGSLLIDAYTSDGFGVFLRHDGRLDPVRQGVPAQWGLTDDDDVVMIDRLIPSWVIDPRGIGYWDGASGGDTLLVWTRGFLHVVATLDSSLPGAPFQSLDNLMVRGDLVLFSGTSRSDQRLHEFLYRPGDSQPQEITPASLAGQILDFSPGGQVLTQAADGFQLVATNGAIIGLIAGTTLDPFALNDAGTVGVIDYLQSGRDVLEITGPGPAANCPVVPTFSGGPTATATPTPERSASPLPGIGTSRAYVADARTDTVAVVDTATQDVLTVIPVPHAPSALTATPDGRRVYVLAGEKVGVIDTRTAQLVGTVSLAEGGAAIAVGPDDDTVYVAGVGGIGRIARVDTRNGIISSVLVSPRYSALGFSPGGGILVAEEDSAHSTAERVAFVDTGTGQMVSSSDPGICADGVAFSPDGSSAYVVDRCRNALELLDVQSAKVIDQELTEQGSGQFGRLVLTSDASRAYASQPGYSIFRNPDGSFGLVQGAVSVVDLIGHSASTISIPGESDHLALTPDGTLLYVTIVQPAPGQLAVIDTASETVRTTLLLGGGPTDVVVAPVPAADAPSPSPTAPGAASVLLRADSAEGVAGDDVPFTVQLETGGRDVGSIEADVSLFNYAWALGSPGCELAPSMVGKATIQYEPAACHPSCVGYRFVVRSADAIQSLPHDGALLSCSLYIVPNEWYVGSSPLLLLNATATAPDGTPLAVTTGDGSITVLSRDQATPRRTPTSSPTPARTWTPLPTVPVGPIPNSLTGGSTSAQPGTTAAVPIGLLLPASTQCATLQFELTVTASSGAPAVTSEVTFASSVGAPSQDSNPAGHPEQVLVGWFSNFSPPLTGTTQLGTLTVPIPSTAQSGQTYTVQVFNPSGTTDGSTDLPMDGVSGTITIVGGSTPTPTATPPPASGNSVQPAVQDASVPRAATLSNGGGCTLTPETNARSQFWLLGTLVVLPLCRWRWSRARSLSGCIRVRAVDHLAP